MTSHFETAPGSKNTTAVEPSRKIPISSPRFTVSGVGIGIVPKGTSRESIPVTVIRPTTIAATMTTVTRPMPDSAGVSIGIATRRFRTNRLCTCRTPIALTG